MSMTPYISPWSRKPDMRRYAPPVKRVTPLDSKLMIDMETLLRKIPLRDGMTLGFHHHLRNGDWVMNMVVEAAAKLGIRDLTLASSSFFPVHAPLLEHMKTGVVTGLDTDYMVGPVADAVSRGLLKKAVVMHSHGGRARALECGELRVDIAFIAASAADAQGNLSGLRGPSAFGSMGYAYSDAEFADVVVGVTDTLMPYPLIPASIPQHRVDFVLQVDSIGDPKGIVSGTTRITRDPVGLHIAKNAARAVAASGLLKDGFSFQTGAGGASLAVAHYLGRTMEKERITGSFLMGGITGYLVDLLEKGLFTSILDVQGFDLEALRSLKENPRHAEVGASQYANPLNSGCIVNSLDCVILGATEIDTEFNVNVSTGSTGLIMGGSGGHSDAAAGSKLTIIVANLLRGRLPIVRDKVTTRTTPGATIDALVTERGIAVNPDRPELVERFKDAGLKVKEIGELKALAESMAGTPRPVPKGGRTVALVEYRDGTLIDEIREVAS